MCYPYRPHGDRKNRLNPLQCNGSGRFVSMIHPSRIPTVTVPVFVIMYYSHPFRLAKSSIAKQNLSHRVNAVCNGSPSRIRSVRRISFGITTRPRSSIRRTMPVAFISQSPLFCCKIVHAYCLPHTGDYAGFVYIRRFMQKKEVSLLDICSAPDPGRTPCPVDERHPTK